MDFIEELKRAKGSALAVADKRLAGHFSTILHDAFSDIGLRPSDWKFVRRSPKDEREGEFLVDGEVMISREGGYIDATVFITVDGDDLVFDVNSSIADDTIVSVHIDGHMVWPRPERQVYENLKAHLLHKVSFLRSHKDDSPSRSQ